MRLPVDDPVMQIDPYWLGLPGWTFPFKVRYGSVVTGFFVALALLLITSRLGVHSVEVYVTVLGFGTYLITSGVMRFVTFDRKLRHIAVIFWHELNGPRPPRQVLATVALPRGIR